MSVDTSHVRPTSTVSAWATLRKQLEAKRAAETAAWRQELGNTMRPKTADELRADIARFNGWLEETTVQSGGALANWIRQQKAATVRKLADLTTGATR